MNSKPIILVAFALWCFVCARWYVCGIKDACKARTPVVEVIQTPTQTPETADSHPEIQPATETNQPAAGNPSTRANGSNTTANSNKPVTAENMDNIQMETVADKMVIHFPYKSIQMEANPEINNYLDNLARQLIASGEQVRITGHTDFVGDSKVNYSVGLRRAYSLRDMLIKKGVAKNQVICKSYGDTKPIATNDTPYGRYLNRRAEIRVGK